MEGIDQGCSRQLPQFYWVFHYKPIETNVSLTEQPAFFKKPLRTLSFTSLTHVDEDEANNLF